VNGTLGAKVSVPLARVGSMGKRRGRRTRSDEGGHSAHLERGVTVDWPGLTGPSIFTVEGELGQRFAVTRNLARAKGWRGVSARALWLLLFPPLAVISLVRDLWGRRKRP
jgi:hypothetical protein